MWVIENRGVITNDGYDAPGSYPAPRKTRSKGTAMTPPTRGTFTAGNPLKDPEQQFAEIGQSVLDGLHRTLVDAQSGWLFPELLVEAITNEIWAHPRQLDYRMVPPMPFREFVTERYPLGLGATEKIVEKLIAGDADAERAWKAALDGAPPPVAVFKNGPLKDMQNAWTRANPEARSGIVAWMRQTLDAEAKG